MKQIYEIPEVTIFEIGPAEQMMLLGSTHEEKAAEQGAYFGNDNNLDDQDSPWYRR